MTRTFIRKGRMRERRNGTRYRVSLEWKPQDAWVGAYWQTTAGPTGKWAALDVWVCLLPCAPLHLFANRKAVGL